jgi:hypothetical protein
LKHGATMTKSGQNEWLYSVWKQLSYSYWKLGQQRWIKAVKTKTYKILQCVKNLGTVGKSFIKLTEQHASKVKWKWTLLNQNFTSGNNVEKVTTFNKSDKQ